MFKAIVTAGLLAACSYTAAAGEAGDLLLDALYSGQFAAGRTALVPLMQDGDPEAAFGVGIIELSTGIERFLQSMHRHGVAAPNAGMLGGLLGTGLHASPVNPDAEPLSYQGFRDILEALVDDLDRARQPLQIAGASGDYVIPLDVLAVSIDTDGDPATPGETLGGLMAANFGIAPGEQGLVGKSKDAHTASTFGLDRADAIWLQGYSQIIAVQAEFLLAHDFSELFNATFHRLFPRADLPMQDFGSGSGLFMDGESDALIADAVALIHSLNFPVVDRGRLAAVLDRLKAITTLSRANWQAILSETDDFRELVPSPSQSTPFAGLEVTEEVVEAWHHTLDAVDKVLAGDLLIPHWRFDRGFDLTSYFTTAERTDLVMILTGYGALPFLADGPVATEGDFAAGLEVFGADFPIFALWFN